MWLFCHLTLAFVALATAGLGAGQPQYQVSLGALLEDYRRGAADAAVDAFASWPADRVERDVDELMATGIDTRARAALVLLHTEAGFRRDDFATGLGRGRFRGFVEDRPLTLMDVHYRYSVGGVDDLLNAARTEPSLAAFLRDWHTLVAARLDLVGLLASRRFPNDALSAMVSGTAMTLTVTYDFPGRGRPYFFEAVSKRAYDQLWNREWPSSHTRVSSGRVIDTGLVQHAEYLFRQALKLDPTLVEAEVRLGHLLQLADRPREAERAYRAVLERATGADRGYSGYLAALFLGQVLQARQEWAPAQAAYEQAVQLRPDARSARMAIADLHVVTGRADAAWHTADALLTPPPVGIAADPLMLFQQGQTSRHDQLLAALRAYVRLP